MCDFGDIYQITLVLLFAGCTGAICLAMLMVQLEIVQVSESYILFDCFEFQ